MSENGGGDAKMANQESRNKNRRRKTKKKKNKKSGNLSNITDINRFILDTCRRLKERKPYLVWNAVGCLGVSALTDLIKEVRTFETHCGSLSLYGMKHMCSVANICNAGVQKEQMAEVSSQACVSIPVGSWSSTHNGFSS